MLGSVTGNTNTVVRKTANGSRTGYLLGKGSSAALIGSPVTSGGYSWYYVKLTNGVKGYVRGDLVTVIYDAGGGITPSVAKTYVKVVDAAGLKLFTTEEAPADGTTGNHRGAHAAVGEQAGDGLREVEGRGVLQRDHPHVALGHVDRFDDLGDAADVLGVVGDHQRVVARVGRYGVVGRHQRADHRHVGALLPVI